MADNSMEMTHAEVWDDSALIDSWNEALDEYKKYHSIHAKGGKLEDGDLQGKPEPQTIDAQTEAVDQPEIVDDAEGANKTKGAGSSTDVQTTPSGVPIAKAISGHGGNGPGPATMGPQSLLGTVQDEGLKRLLMSWYYAGYYTGLYEGQQQQQQQQPSK
ncbi:survival motor neuron-like protein 1 [Colletotrichum tofieldiae]|uniref:Survival motor neuron-like protein 1 n=1 Tax=Colletotrichum tofieldiae TaxID=708197 RepID=A0A166RTS3_9PEZI|nr:survival motor neuron-like protein 1 [Colletotrichum tofieldiae]